MPARETDLPLESRECHRSYRKSRRFHYSSCVDLHYIFVVDDVVALHLRAGSQDGTPPDASVFEIGGKIPVDKLGHFEQCAAAFEGERFVVIGLFLRG